MSAKEAAEMLVCDLKPYHERHYSFHLAFPCSWDIHSGRRKLLCRMDIQTAQWADPRGEKLGNSHSEGS